MLYCVRIRVADGSCVVEEHAKCHWHPLGEVIAGDLPALQITVDGLIQADACALECFHNGQRGQGFGDGLRLEECLGGDRPVVVEISPAKALGPDNFSVIDDSD